MNSHDCHQGQLALFLKASKWSHSCQPNCRYQFADGFLRYVAVEDIKADEMMTFSYISSTDLQLPAARRQEILWNTKAFECRCTRCCAQSDNFVPPADVGRFRPETSSLPLPAKHDPDESDSDEDIEMK